MEKNGFTLIELLIVIAISMILIGFAITSSKSLQAQQVLQSSVSNFISKLSFIKSEAVSGTHSFNGNIAISTPSSGITNWVYGFYVVPAISTSSVCASSCDGYDIVMAVKDITIGSQCNDQNSNNTPSFDNTIPPANNSLYNNLNTNNFTGSVSPLSSCIGNSNGLPSNSITPTGYTYFHGFFPGVNVSSTTSTFPMFEEVSGYVYLYNNSSPYTVVGSSSPINQAIFTFKYQGYQENVYINDIYNNQSQSDSIYSGGIRYE